MPTLPRSPSETCIIAAREALDGDVERDGYRASQVSACYGQVRQQAEALKGRWKWRWDAASTGALEGLFDRTQRRAVGECERGLVNLAFGLEAPLGLRSRLGVRTQGAECPAPVSYFRSAARSRLCAAVAAAQPALGSASGATAEQQETLRRLEQTAHRVFTGHDARFHVIWVACYVRLLPGLNDAQLGEALRGFYARGGALAGEANRSPPTVTLPTCEADWAAAMTNASGVPVPDQLAALVAAAMPRLAAVHAMWTKHAQAALASPGGAGGVACTDALTRFERDVVSWPRGSLQPFPNDRARQAELAQLAAVVGRSVAAERQELARNEATHRDQDRARLAAANLRQQSVDRLDAPELSDFRAAFDLAVAEFEAAPVPAREPHRLRAETLLRVGTPASSWLEWTGRAVRLSEVQRGAALDRTLVCNARARAGAMVLVDQLVHEAATAPKLLFLRGPAQSGRRGVAEGIAAALERACIIVDPRQVSAHAHPQAAHHHFFGQEGVALGAIVEKACASETQPPLFYISHLDEAQPELCASLKTFIASFATAADSHPSVYCDGLGIRVPMANALCIVAAEPDGTIADWLHGLGVTGRLTTALTQRVRPTDGPAMCELGARHFAEAMAAARLDADFVAVSLAPDAAAWYLQYWGLTDADGRGSADFDDFAVMRQAFRFAYDDLFTPERNCVRPTAGEVLDRVRLEQIAEADASHPIQPLAGQVPA